MAYQAPLSERIRIQLEVFCENCTDCFAHLSQNYKRPILVLSGIAVLLTIRTSRRGIKSAKMGGIMGGGYGGAYGGAYGAKKKGFFSRFRKSKTPTYGAYGSSSYGSTAGGLSQCGGASAGGLSQYGGAAAAGGLSQYGGASAGGLSQYGAAGRSSSYGAGAGLRGGTAMGGASAGGYGSTLGGAGASSYGGASSFGGASTFGGASSMGGAAGGKSTATLADSNPTSIVTLDPSIHFYDYGGSASFSGQIETVQAYGAPNFVAQVLNQPGQGKVLVVDGGGIRSDMGAVLDKTMIDAAARNGWKGVIVNGMVRNVDQLRTSNIGVKALGASPVKGKGAMGQKGMALNIGTTQLQPGWWVYADGDGVVVSQTDISGGSFGAGGMGGGTPMMSGGYGATAGSAMGGAGGFGSTATTGGYGGGAAGGLGSTTGGLAGGYGNTATRTTLGGAGGYGSATGGYGSATAGGLTGGYGSTAAGGGLGGAGSRVGTYGAGTTAGGYGGYGSGSSTYGSYGARKKKKKVFKMLLASSIAAIVWLVCLR